MLAVVSQNTRASDNDRTDICGVLDAALEDGQLSTEEHRERVSAATKAVTLGELRSLVSDLQIHGTAVQPPALKLRRRGILIAGASAIVMAGFGITWGLLGRNPSPPNLSAPTTTSTPKTTTPITTTQTTTTTTTPAPPPDLLNLSGVTGVLAQMRVQFGDTLGYELHIYSDDAVVIRPDTANAHKTMKWTYQYGRWSDPRVTTAVFSDSGVGDLSKFDVQAVLGVLKNAPQTLQLYDSPTTDFMVESLKNGNLYIQIAVSDATRRSGLIVVGPNGAVNEVSPPTR